MTIYILDNDPKKTAEYLDDKSLDKMICDISSVFCNVHLLLMNIKIKGVCFPPIESGMTFGKADKKCIWSKWAIECKANYEYLVELGLCCADEWEFRFTYEYGKPQKHHNLWDNLLWASHHVPDLNDHLLLTNPPQEPKHTTLPLVMPNKFMYFNSKKLIGNYNQEREIILSYRKYYQDKLKQKPICFSIWKKRKKPQWLNL